VVLLHRASVASHVLEQPVEGGAEVLLVARLARGHRGLVELVSAQPDRRPARTDLRWRSGRSSGLLLAGVGCLGGLRITTSPLRLARRPTGPSCPAGWLPPPSSDFMRASSSSTSLELDSSLSWRSMSSSPGPRVVMSSNVPAASSSCTALARPASARSCPERAAWPGPRRPSPRPRRWPPRRSAPGPRQPSTGP